MQTTMCTRLIAGLIALSGIAGFPAGVARAEVPDAMLQDVRWFVGKWAVGAADMAGFETIAGAPDCKAAIDIVEIGPASIRRIVRLKSGEVRSNDFTVKSFGGNFPWWSKDGTGGPVAKRIDADSFVLATTRSGKADWANGLKHKRCP